MVNEGPARVLRAIVERRLPGAEVRVIREEDALVVRIGGPASGGRGRRFVPLFRVRYRASRPHWTAETPEHGDWVDVKGPFGLAGDACALLELEGDDPEMEG